MQRAQSGAQAVQRGAVRALMRHWPVAAAAAVAWPIDAGSANAGSVRALGGRARSACELAGPFRSEWAARTGQSAASECTCTSMLGAGQSWSLSMRGARRDWSARHERPETARRSAITIAMAPIPQTHLRHALGASRGRGARTPPTGLVRQDGTTPACWEQASYLQVQSNNPACLPRVRRTCRVGGLL